MRSVLLVVSLVIGSSACGSEAPETPPPAPAPAPVEASALDPALEEDFPDDPQPAEGEVVPTPTSAELESMGRPELEAACFAGSTAACDRLGH